MAPGLIPGPHFLFRQRVASRPSRPQRRHPLAPDRHHHLGVQHDVVAVGQFIRKVRGPLVQVALHRASVSGVLAVGGPRPVAAAGNQLSTGTLLSST